MKLFAAILFSASILLMMKIAASYRQNRRILDDEYPESVENEFDDQSNSTRIKVGGRSFSDRLIMDVTETENEEECCENCLAGYTLNPCNHNKLRVSVDNVREGKDVSKACFSVMYYFSGSKPCFEATYTKEGVSFILTQGVVVVAQTLLFEKTKISKKCHSLAIRSDLLSLCLKWKNVVWGQNKFKACLFLHIVFRVKGARDFKIHCVELRKGNIESIPLRNPSGPDMLQSDIIDQIYPNNKPEQPGYPELYPEPSATSSYTGPDKRYPVGNNPSYSGLYLKPIGKSPGTGYPGQYPESNEKIPSSTGTDEGYPTGNRPGYHDFEGKSGGYSPGISGGTQFPKKNKPYYPAFPGLPEHGNNYPTMEPGNFDHSRVQPNHLPGDPSLDPKSYPSPNDSKGESRGQLGQTTDKQPNSKSEGHGFGISPITNLGTTGTPADNINDYHPSDPIGMDGTIPREKGASEYPNNPKSQLSPSGTSPYTNLKEVLPAKKKPCSCEQNHSGNKPVTENQGLDYISHPQHIDPLKGKTEQSGILPNLGGYPTGNRPGYHDFDSKPGRYSPGFVRRTQLPKENNRYYPGFHGLPEHGNIYPTVEPGTFDRSTDQSNNLPGDLPLDLERYQVHHAYPPINRHKKNSPYGPPISRIIYPTIEPSLLQPSTDQQYMYPENNLTPGGVSGENKGQLGGSVDNSLAYPTFQSPLDTIPAGPSSTDLGSSSVLGLENNVHHTEYPTLEPSYHPDLPPSPGEQRHHTGYPPNTEYPWQHDYPNSPGIDGVPSKDNVDSQITEGHNIDNLPQPNHDEGTLPSYNLYPPDGQLPSNPGHIDDQYGPDHDNEKAGNKGAENQGNTIPDPAILNPIPGDHETNSWGPNGNGENVYHSSDGSNYQNRGQDGYGNHVYLENNGYIDSQFESNSSKIMKTTETLQSLLLHEFYKLSPIVIIANGNVDLKLHNRTTLSHEKSNYALSNLYKHQAAHHTITEHQQVSKKTSRQMKQRRYYQGSDIVNKETNKNS